jgi:hypothetical protein
VRGGMMTTNENGANGAGEQPDHITCLPLTTPASTHLSLFPDHPNLLA